MGSGGVCRRMPNREQVRDSLGRLSVASGSDGVIAHSRRRLFPAALGVVPPDASAHRLAAAVDFGYCCVFVHTPEPC